VRRQVVIPAEVENHDGVRRQVVIPAEAGIQKNKKVFYNRLDSCFRRNDERIGKTFHQLNGRRA
ncbi:MAG: hypothetical protein WBC02_10800, partial [Candidatus Aminicenantaceae bacterium]